MVLNSTVDIEPWLQDKILQIFSELTLAEKIIVYTKLVHGNNFKSQNGDMLHLNRRLNGQIYQNFLNKVKSEL